MGAKYIRCRWWGGCYDVRNHEFYGMGYEAGKTAAESQCNYLCDYYRDEVARCRCDEHLRLMGNGMRADHV